MKGRDLKDVKVLHIFIDKRSLQKLQVIDPKECELGTLYIHISGWGRYKASDLYNVGCKDYFSHIRLQEWLDSLRGPRGRYMAIIKVV